MKKVNNFLRPLIMKKIIVLLIFTQLFLSIKSNPIYSIPNIQINKFFFDSTGNWVIELYYYNFDTFRGSIPDTAWLGSLSGKAKLIKNIVINGEKGFVVVRKDSLSSNLTINKDNDSIALTFTDKNGYAVNNIDYLIYGNSLHSYIQTPKKGQSIAKLQGFYSICKFQKLGIYDDTLGMCGSLFGHVYDRNNKLFTGNHDQNFVLDNSFKIKQDGSYSVRVYSYIHKLKYISYNVHGPWFYSNIGLLEFNMEPDSVIERDIYLCDTILSGNKILGNFEDEIINVWPNPVKGKLEFKYEIGLPVVSIQCSLHIIDMKGNKIRTYHVKDNKGSIQVPSGMKNGIYLVQLSVNNKNYFSKKIIIYR
jgi:hypothetical protein